MSKPEVVTWKRIGRSTEPPETPRVGVVLGSDSDVPKLRSAFETLDNLGVAYEVIIASAHRTPEMVREYGLSARDRGLEVIVAAAGKAAHLPGVLAAYTSLPVIGLPLAGDAFNGLDALMAIVQMPSGVPVGCVAVDGAQNAALLAAQILAIKHQGVAREIERFREAQRARVEDKARQFAQSGPFSTSGT